MNPDLDTRWVPQSPAHPFFLSLTMDPDEGNWLPEEADAHPTRYAGALRLLDEWLAEPGDEDDRVLHLLERVLHEEPILMAEE